MSFIPFGKRAVVDCTKCDNNWDGWCKIEKQWAFIRGCNHKQETEIEKKKPQHRWVCNETGKKYYNLYDIALEYNQEHNTLKALKTAMGVDGRMHTFKRLHKLTYDTN